MSNSNSIITLTAGRDLRRELHDRLQYDEYRRFVIANDDTNEIEIHTRDIAPKTFEEICRRIQPLIKEQITSQVDLSSLAVAERATHLYVGYRINSLAYVDVRWRNRSYPFRSCNSKSVTLDWGNTSAAAQALAFSLLYYVSADRGLARQFAHVFLDVVVSALPPRGFTLPEPLIASWLWVKRERV